jgi:hypothetical protein
VFTALHSSVSSVISILSVPLDIYTTETDIVQEDILLK